MLQDLRKQLYNLNYVKEQLGLLIPFFEYLKVNNNYNYLPINLTMIILVT